jgi:hypothetical protein
MIPGAGEEVGWPAGSGTELLGIALESWTTGGEGAGAGEDNSPLGSLMPGLRVRTPGAAFNGVEEGGFPERVEDGSADRPGRLALSGEGDWVGFKKTVETTVTVRTLLPAGFVPWGVPPGIEEGIEEEGLMEGVKNGPAGLTESEEEVLTSEEEELGSEVEVLRSEVEERSTESGVRDGLAGVLEGLTGVGSPAGLLERVLL